MELPVRDWVLVAENPSYLEMRNDGISAVAYAYGNTAPQSIASDAGDFPSDDYFVLDSCSEPYWYRGDPIGVNVYATSLGPRPGLLHIIASS